MRLDRRLIPLLFGVVGCSPAPAKVHPRAGAAEPTARAQLGAVSLKLPGANGPAALDFLFYEAGRDRVWVPAGSTGSVDVLATATSHFTRITGFKTEEREAHGKNRVVGPSSGSIGEGFAYVGNRAGNEVCPVDLVTLKPMPCFALPSQPDGVQYVASSRELWVTLPQARTIAVLDATSPPGLKPKAMLELDGAPECYALDAGHGRFFTNLEDKGGTLAIDIFPAPAPQR
jgi:hypothetical protein